MAAGRGFEELQDMTAAARVAQTRVRISIISHRRAGILHSNGGRRSGLPARHPPQPFAMRRS
jgi:hypothetical protein